MERAAELGLIRETLLQEIRPALRAGVEQRHRVARLGMLAEHDDAHVGVFFPRLGGQPTFRSFVWMQGHNYVNLQDPRVLPTLLRGIAWAAKAPIDSLMTVRPAPATFLKMLMGRSSRAA